MAKRVQILRDTAANVAAFVGLAGEMEYGTDSGYFYIHTGAGAGTQKEFRHKTANDALYQAKTAALTEIAAGGYAETFNFSGLTSVSNVSILAGNAVLTSAQIAGLVVTQTATLQGTLLVQGTAQFSQQVTALNTTQLQGMVNVSGNAHFSQQIVGQASVQIQGFADLQGVGQHKRPQMVIQAIGSTSGSISQDLTAGKVITITQNNNTLTITQTNWAVSGIYDECLYIITLDATPHTVTFTGITWDSSSGAPTLVAGKKLVVAISTDDGGVTKRGVFLGCF